MHSRHLFFYIVTALIFHRSNTICRSVTTRAGNEPSMGLYTNTGMLDVGREIAALFVLAHLKICNASKQRYENLINAATVEEIS